MISEPWVFRTAPRASTFLYALARSSIAGETWVLPGSICEVVPLTLCAARRPFIFADVEREFLAMSAATIAAAIKSRTEQSDCAVVFVRPYGADADQTREMHRLRATFPDAFIIDDRCLAMPDLGPPPTDFPADAVLYSLGDRKPVELGGAFGWFRPRAASVLDLTTGTRPDSYDAVARLFRAMVRDGTTHQGPGGSMIGLDKFDWVPLGPGPDVDMLTSRIPPAVDAARHHKDAINRIYRQGLDGLEILPDGYHDWRFNLMVKDRDRVLRAIFDAGLFASAHYQPLATVFGHSPTRIAERLAGRVLNLFNCARVSPEAARRTVEIIRRFT